MSNNVITREYIFFGTGECISNRFTPLYTGRKGVHVHRVEIIRKSTIMLLIILEI